MRAAQNDALICSLLAEGRLVVDADTGEVFAPRSNTPSKPIGAPTKKGYLRTCINRGDRQIYLMVHRIVWIAIYGRPSDATPQIDHQNRNKADNRPSNLAAVSNDENMRRARLAGAFRGVGRRDGIRDSKGRFGKRAAGRLLDGREWNEFPEVPRA